ncbi:MAG TPA: hypothetical protein VG435_10760, partial [Acidimicrobiales bacterium]|nr:hypothetical protein [Acidimicrobiales bacterium]
MTLRARPALLLVSGFLIAFSAALVGLLGLGQWSPASAAPPTNATTCSVTNSVLTVSLGDGQTTLTYSGTNVTYSQAGGGSAVCTGSYTSVSVTAPVADTAPGVTISEAGGSVWPCTANYITINSAVPLTVQGSSTVGGTTKNPISPDIIAGTSGINIDLVNCPTTETIATGSASSIDLVGGTKSATISVAGGSGTRPTGQTPDGPVSPGIPVTLDGSANTASTPDDFILANGNDTLAAGVTGSELDLSPIAPACSTGACTIIANLGASATDTTPSVPSDTIEVLSGTTVVYTDTISSGGADFTNFSGSGSTPTYVYADTATTPYTLNNSVIFEGGAGDYTVNIANSGTGDKVVAGTGTQNFTVSGSSVTFVGGTGTDTFTVTGSSNTFEPGAGTDNFYDSGTGNTVDFTQVGASQTEPLVINDSGTNETVGSVSFGQGQAGLVTSSTPVLYTFHDSPTVSTSADFSTLIGASTGNTEFLAGGTGGISLSGQGSNNSAAFFGTNGIVVDLQSLQKVTTNLAQASGDPVTGFQIASGEILVAPPSSLQASCAGNTLCDSVSDIFSVTGPTSGYSTFYAGPAPNSYN